MQINSIHFNNGNYKNPKKAKRINNFKGTYSVIEESRKVDELYARIENPDYSNYDRFEKLKEKMDFEYIAEKTKIEKKWFPKRKLAKLEIRYAGRKQELSDHQNEFVEEKLSKMDELQLLIDSLEARGASIDYINDLKNNYIALEKSKEIAISQKNNDVGLNRIAGYNEEIGFIQKVFINPVINEKCQLISDVPGGILFFGPTGCGKTKLVNAVAETIYPNKEERSIYFKDIKTYDEDVLEQIESVLDEAKDNFEKTHCRTIILLDEIETIANKDTPKNLLDGLKGKLSEAKENYCTFFMTSNYPAEVHPDIIASNRAEYAISIDPPNRENKKAVAHYYFDKLNIQNLNYSKIVDTIESCEQKGYFSNSGIEDIYENCKNIKGLDENKLIDIIKSQKINIKKSDFEEYIEQKKLFENME